MEMEETSNGSIEGEAENVPDDQSETGTEEIAPTTSSKSPSKQKSARKNIRSVMSLKDLNPETRKAMEEEEKLIGGIGLGGTSSTSRPSSPVSSDSDIEIIEENIRSPIKPSLSQSRYQSSFSQNRLASNASPVKSEANGPVSSNGEIICVDKTNYPSISSFHCDDSENKPGNDGKILINTSRTKRDAPIHVADHLAPHLRPHQIGGIRFMYATLIESVGKFTNMPGHGGVLAHSMGLGKTLQVITFLDAIFRHTPVKTVIVVAPLNTMAHWIAEFNKWLPNDVRPERLKVTCIRDQKPSVRHDLVKAWAKEGGVLMMGYEKLRTIADPKGTCGKKKKRTVADMDEGDGETPGSEAVYKAAGMTSTEKDVSKLLMTSADIIICDEGHRIKSVDAAVTKLLKQISTKRRLILTGYPLQNNLMEYWCMIDFVRPHLLGTEPEFTNLFKNPIENGQCADSTEQDRALMRQRTYILQKLLSRIVQRRDNRPLVEELPNKLEFAILFRQTPTQNTIYRALVEELQKQKDMMNAIGLYSTFRHITQHPAIFFRYIKKLEQKDAQDDYAETGPIRQLLIELVRGGLWDNYLVKLEKMVFDEIHSGKMLFLKYLVSEAVVKLKEKIILFTQSLELLDYLQEYVPLLLSEGQEAPDDTFPPTFRIDGSTSSVERERLINMFNDESHGTMIFLISTDAGGIGINLTGACRVVIMDVSWNPSKDIQAISRIYRYGQSRTSVIYRLVGDGSMEKCVFDRQIHKQCLFKRVVDDKSPFLAVSSADLASLFQLGKCSPADWHRICRDEFPPEAANDPILKALSKSDVFRQYLSRVPMVMDSILEADDSTQLSETERQAAEANYHTEKSNGGVRGMFGNRSIATQLPLSQNAMPLSQASPPRGPLPPIQIALEVIVRDQLLCQRIRDKARRMENFQEEMMQVALRSRMQLICSTLPNQGFFLQPIGGQFHFAVRPDGTAWRVGNPVPTAPMPSGSQPQQPQTLNQLLMSMQQPSTSAASFAAGLPVNSYPVNSRPMPPSAPPSDSDNDIIIL